MIRFYDSARTQWAARQRVHRKSLATALAAAALLQPTFARAATIDWNVAGPENYNSALDPDAGATPNWKDTTQAVPATPPAVPPTNNPVGIPAAGDQYPAGPSPFWERNGSSEARPGPVILCHRHPDTACDLR